MRTRRVCYGFLCAAPFVAGALVAARPLRVPGVYHAIGLVQFSALAFAAWSLGLRVLKRGGDDRRRLAIAGALLLAPIALTALFWVGLVPPWVATAPENRMRYLVLLAGAMTVACGFIVLKESLCAAGEGLYSTLGFATNIFAGAAYLFWVTTRVAAYVAIIREGQVPPAIVPFLDMIDALLFAACVLTYLTVAAFAASMGRAGWLGRRAARIFVGLNLTALVFIMIRGLSFPDPMAGATPWYLQPGFIAGIPAVPWIMPFLLGVVVLRRAGADFD